ncbi:helix-turn-helix transcriptional regulator [bacterium AH-315-I18]|nr:helix-turn-helix transcriptional regulator [bacterium AH-315-I18]
MIPASSHLQLFDETLWQASFAGCRSKNISPLYVDRYRGPRKPGLLSTHDFWELTVTMGGTGTLVGSSDITLKPATICLVAPHLQHAEQGESDLDTIWLGFTGRHLPKLQTLCSVKSKALTTFVEQLWIFSKQRGGPIGPELDGLTLAAVAWFFRLLDEGTSVAQDSLMDRAVAYLDEHFSQNIAVTDIARQLHCSEGHVHRAFKRHTGHSPIGYLSHVRVRHAAHLLENTDISIADVARQVGYPDQFYFSRVFRKLLHQSPLYFRKHSRSS